MRLAQELAKIVESGFGLVCLARVEAGQGREEDCRAHVEAARRLAEAFGVGSIITYCFSVLGLLELGLRRPAQAIPHLEQVAKLVEERGLGEPAVVQWAPDLVEAYALGGHGDDARQSLARFEREAERTGRTWALAAAARCRGRLAEGEDFEDEFEAALRLHELTPTPFERARTELRYGERLRRTRRLAEARVRLRSALETFEQLGAAPWAGQARRELAAAGAKERARREPRLRELTPQELQVALLVAEGATNRETAAALFLSPKTVEFHLGKVFRKLGVRSRTELALLVARENALVEVAGGHE